MRLNSICITIRAQNTLRIKVLGNDDIIDQLDAVWWLHGTVFKDVDIIFLLFGFLHSTNTV
jgi:hypothetical protein